MVAPVPPAQNVTSDPALATGIGFTVTVTLSELIQPKASVAVSVYVVVAAGVTVGPRVVEFVMAVVGDHA